MTAEPEPHPIVLFDRECGLCMASVEYLLKHDRRGQLRFAALQGETGRTALARQGYYFPGSDAAAGESGLKPAPDSHCVIVDAGLSSERLLFESAALLYIARCLGGWRGALAVLGSLVPRRLADGLYRAIARRRHRLAPRTAYCRLPKSD